MTIKLQKFHLRGIQNIYRLKVNGKVSHPVKPFQNEKGKFYCLLLVKNLSCYYQERNNVQEHQVQVSCSHQGGVAKHTFL